MTNTAFGRRISLKSDFLNDIEADLQLAEELGFNPYYPRSEARRAGHVMIDGNWYTDFASNDYLGLATDSELAGAYRETIHRFGVSLCGTPIAAGGNRLLEEMENRLAGYVGCEAAMAFPSCYQANMSLFATFFGREDCIIIDHYAHASLVAGVRSTGCKVLPFIHNDCNHLEKLLSRSNDYRQTAVVTESVFSTEGAIAPFDRIYELCRQYDALPIIDDSHGIGVIGKNGSGILDHCSLTSFNGLYTASLGKALANSGGIIAGGKKVIETMKYRCAGSMYSTGMIPAVSAGVLHVLDRIEKNFLPLFRQLCENRSILHSALDKKGFTVMESSAPILAVLCGTKRETIDFAHELYKKHIVATPFVEPSVPPGRGVVRFIPGAGITTERCREAANAIESMQSL
ncbi:MAG: pyridoxal phosphate-dependent aminotransferase family protein [Chitinispirillaceae bacterium]|nr:pyridoxal phosphate-dependent aminotransferase family protein [Chitinispirillaceae bacterium]